VHSRTLRVTVEAQGGDPERRGVLMVLGGGRPGTLITIGDEPVVVGRTDESDVVLGDESLSRRHARFMKMHGQHFIQDLGSTNGTFVDGAKVSEPVALEEGARIQLGKNTLLRFALQDEHEYRASLELYEATVRDPLTGLHNRYYFDERLQSEFAFAKRHGVPLSVLFVDADHFKQVNDTYGHPAGDEVLRRLAELLAETVRAEDVVARIGGEEFVLLIRDVAPEGLLVIAERLRAGAEAMVVEHEEHRISFTVSIGIATLTADSDYASPQGLVAEADALLYQAKEAGRNRVHSR
jgi:diguanylate cyclase (GGDEF)-like protein